MKPYPKYRPSGVEWFPEIPQHWEVWKLAHAVPVISSGTTPNTQNPDYYIDGTIPWVNTGDLNDGLLNECGKCVTERAVQDHTLLKLYPSGSIVIALYGATIGKLGILGFSACVNQACCVMAPSSFADGSFLFFWLLGFRQRIIALASGGGQPNISQEIVRSLRLPLPPLPEQQAIAGFLDVEVGKIDALVAEQRRLIGLLAEKRQAVISHAVTRGLNPQAPLKPSGIDWLGDIPEDWEVVPLKRDLDFLTSGSRGWADYYSDEGAVFVRIGNLTREGIGLDLSDIQRVSVPKGTEGERTRIRGGDLLFSITAFLGSVAVAPEDIDESYVSQHVALARLRQERLLPEWVAFLTLSYIGKTYLASQGYGGTKVQLSLDDIANLTVTCPTLKEQGEILAFLKKELARFDTLTTTAQSAIDLLQERRAALISAAVTGKIDLRHLIPEQ